MLEKDYKFYFEGSPIDFFLGTMTKDQLINSLQNECLSENLEDIIEENYAFVFNKVLELSKEKPQTIRYFAVPRYGWGDTELCALAKIDNNGSTFMFTNNKYHAEFISSISDYDFDVHSL